MRDYASRNRLGRGRIWVFVVLVFSAVLLALVQGDTADAAANHSPVIAGRSADNAFAQRTAGDRPGPQLAQITVRPDAPKRVFEEKEDKPWTLLIGKAMLPATLGLGALLVLWYVVKLTRIRYKRP